MRNMKRMKERKSDYSCPNHRIDKNFAEELKELARFRYFKGLEKKEPTLAEITRVIPRQEEWKSIVNKLKTRQRKENLK